MTIVWETGVGVGVGVDVAVGLGVFSVPTVADTEASCVGVGEGVGEDVGVAVLCLEPKIKAAPPTTKRARITNMPRRVLFTPFSALLGDSASGAGMTCSSSTSDIIDKCLSQVKFGIIYK